MGQPSQELHKLPFDRILGGEDNPRPAVLYADLDSASFRKFHKTISKTAAERKTSYRLRYKPAIDEVREPITVSGYGVELALKRTDYIVIDDRPSEQGDRGSTQKPVDIELHDDEDVTDLKPLSKDDVSDLGLKAASFVMKSEQQMDTLLKLVQDFPKYSRLYQWMNRSLY